MSYIITTCYATLAQGAKTVSSLSWRALKTPTSETPDSEVTWRPHSRFNISGPDPLGFDWEDLAASRGTVGGHSGPPLIKQPRDWFP